ncbi:MAG: hypothetical protein ACR2IE_06255 [Candidatus Sumerlaeaceae bacterium]
MSGLEFKSTSRWRVSGEYNPAVLIRALKLIVPPQSSSILHLEGVGSSPELLRWIEQHEVPNAPRVRPGTLWPKATQHAIHLTDSVSDWAAQFLETHAAPEFCIHLHLSSDGELLMTGYDFGASTLELNTSIPESQVAAFAATIGCSYCKEEH